MANKMLIDASHPEETRVVVLRGNRVEDFDFESATKKPLRGNIYLAKVTRVEPSLQAAFIDYGGNRHGFLAFSEIHPDYYQIPVSDRQALIEEEARAHRDEEDEEPRGHRRSRRNRNGDRDGRAKRRHRSEEEAAVSGEEADFTPVDEQATASGEPSAEASDEARGETPAGEHEAPAHTATPAEISAEVSSHETANADNEPSEETVAADEDHDVPPPAAVGDEAPGEAAVSAHEPVHHSEEANGDTDAEGESEAEDEPVEQLGGDDSMEDVARRTYRPRRQYKIQEVIKRRQILLVQVVKEERGNKGAALTTYLSLAGRYSVLMPNTGRGGGISRKITDSEDRQRLKAIAQELEVPEGMGVILRTAGASRTKPEVKRDFEYLMRLWETVRETTLQSTAPTLVYEEGSLIKRAIRDLYSKEIDEITVAGETGFREARDFMRLLMPSHVRNVRFYQDPQPVFAKSGVDAQLDAMFSNQVTLKSGGYLVINQTEALVAIDVNSGRSTREHDIEDTAVRTNLEAADEVARQLRLRDLAGLIVVDFIDMEESRNNRAVERRVKDALKNDRARIQIGRISHFGLLEMSRQRMRTGVLEGSTVPCPHCAGTGTVRSTSSIALHVLRVIEDALIKSATHNVTVKTRTIVALYILNQKRVHLADLERRFGIVVTVMADDSLSGATYHALERGDIATGPIQASVESVKPVAGLGTEDLFADEEVEAEAVDETAEDEETDAGPETAEADDGEEGDGRRRRRRRRRRGRNGDREVSDIAPNAPQPSDEGLGVLAAIDGQPAETDSESEAEAAEGDAPREPRGRRRRSRRGGRGPREETARGETETPREGAWVRPAPEPEPYALPVTDAMTTEETAAAATPVVEDAVEAPAAPEHTVETQVSEPVAAERKATPILPAVDDPDRPKRTGWWQRAKATLGG